MNSVPRVSPRWGSGHGGDVPLKAPGSFFLLIAMLGLFSLPGGLAAASGARGADDEAGKKNAAPPLTFKPSEETRIYPGDLLFVQVFDVEQLTREYRVSGSGTLMFPLLSEPIKAAGLTPWELADAISRKCKEAGVLSHPQIDVTIRESRFHSVVVSGAVRAPQIYSVMGHIALTDILSQAGGVADDAGPTVTVTRGEAAQQLLASKDTSAVGSGGGQQVPPTVTINLRKLLETGDPSLNIDVYPGDRVMVQRAGVIYVLGAVNRAGGYVLSDARQSMTVLKALALAGDLRSTAKSKHTIILRPDSSAPSGRQEIQVDLHAMLKGHAPDKELLANDILYVPDSTALKALHKSVEVASWAAISAAIYTAY